MSPVVGIDDRLAGLHHGNARAGLQAAILPPLMRDFAGGLMATFGSHGCDAIVSETTL